MPNELIHIGRFAVFLGLEQKGIIFCPGCKKGLAKEAGFKRVPDDCPLCGAAIWYKYGGQMDKKKLEDLKKIKLNKNNLNGINLVAFFIQAYEKNTGDKINPSEDCIYPAFGHYWDSKIVRSIETVHNTSFRGVDEDTLEYLRFFIGKCKAGDFRVDLISDVELSDEYAYNKHRP